MAGQGQATGLDLASLSAAYASGDTTPTEVAELVAQRVDGAAGEAIWIHRIGRDALRAAAADVQRRRAAGEALPLYGIPFAVKDNIDVAGLPTTAACPGYATVAAASATVVTKLLAAGALLVGKTNLDQFATGLVGVRSPYGVPRNPFDPRYIVGGSSSGSAAAVARGLVSFALGTDTAGSGRVPAAFTNTVGLKPSRGLLSTAGVVPACRSLDCVSVFALAVQDAAAVADVARGHDAADPYASPAADGLRFAGAAAPPSFRFAVPRPADLEFFGDGEAARLHAEAVARLEAMGGRRHEIDLAPFREAAGLLYDGPWVAERLAPFETFLAEKPEAFLPVTRTIIGGGARYGATDVFRGLHRLEGLRRTVAGVLAAADALVLPTTPTIYSIAEVEADPIRLNARLGLYTNFVNLLDLAAVAVPAGFRADGLPAGVSLIGPRESDARLCALAGAFHRALGGTVGATGSPLPAPAPRPPGPPPGWMRLAVVGAHLAGQPLNHQLTDLGAHLARACRTSPAYRLYALPNTAPPKPGLVRVSDGGAAIEIEIWELPAEAFGAFFARVAPPLCIGTLEADDGERVPGFLCEAFAVAGARDITALGGWRAFLRQ